MTTPFICVHLNELFCNSCNAKVVVLKEYSSEDISAAEVKEFFLYIGGDLREIPWLGVGKFFCGVVLTTIKEL